MTRKTIGRTIPPPRRGVFKNASQPGRRVLIAFSGLGHPVFGNFNANWGNLGGVPVGLGSAAGLARTGLLYGGYLPDAGWDPVAKVIISSVINAVGYGNLEQGVYDQPEPVIYPVLSGPILEIPQKSAVPQQTNQPEFLPGWPEEWKKQPGDEPGWIEDQWEYPQEEPVAFWDGVSAVVDIFQGQTPGGNVMATPLAMAQPTGGLSGPSGTLQTMGSKVTVDTATGKVTPCRRRRRRRLLTPTDLNDLAALKTIVGGGQSMNFAVMKAVRR